MADELVSSPSRLLIVNASAELYVFTARRSIRLNASDFIGIADSARVAEEPERRAALPGRLSRVIAAYEGNKSQGERLHRGRGLTNRGSVHRDVARKKSQIRAREAWRFISDGALVSREASRGVALADDARS